MPLRFQNNRVSAGADRNIRFNRLADEADSCFFFDDRSLHSYHQVYIFGPVFIFGNGSSAHTREKFMSNRLDNLQRRWKKFQEGKMGYILAWALGVPIPILLIVYFLRGCN